MILEYENLSFWRLGEFIWMGTDSELSSPNQSLMIATIHADGKTDETLSFDLFKLFEGKLLKYKEHAAILQKSYFGSAKTVNFTHGRIVWRNTTYGRDNGRNIRGPILTQAARLCGVHEKFSPYKNGSCSRCELGSSTTDF